ncbi:MAG TPA: AMP-binding protein [Bryobacteraceae bacterium]|nr:AMP-binding protein [Bryobacteraceae bacterium]
MALQPSPALPDDFLDLQKWATVSPNAIAVDSPGRAPLPYSALWKHVQAMSDAFIRAGLGPQTVAALSLPSDPYYLTAVLAVTLRSCCTPLDPGLTTDEYRNYLQRVGASTLIAAEGSASRAVDIARQLGMAVILIRATNQSTGLFSIADVQAPSPELAPRRTDAAFLMLTSSTTGAPKLVPWSRANVRSMALQDIRAFQLTGQDCFLALMPFFSSHSIYTLLTQIACGGRVGCPVSLDPGGIRAAFEAIRPTWTSGGPATHQMLLAEAREHSAFFQKLPLRFIRSAGAPPEEGLLGTLEKLLGVPVLDSYGLSEIPGVARNTPGHRKHGSLGSSVGAEIGIMDDAGNLLPPNTPGEIVARGATLMSGYLDNPEANQAAFHDGWFRTGDLGRLDHDGFLFLVGRKKEMINRGGTKISPREVDDALASHPAVDDVAVFAIPHRTLGEDVAAAVVLKPFAEVSDLELQRHVAGRLAAYKVPRRIIVVLSIPRTALGKARRADLSEQFGSLAIAGSLVGRDPRTRRPPTEVETRLIAIWRRFLGLADAAADIGVDDSFFDLGGTSLSVSSMLVHVETDFDLTGRLDASRFFDQPNVSTLAGIVTESRVPTALPASGNNRILLFQKDGDFDPFFCFSHSTSDSYVFRHLARELGPRQPFVTICPPRADQNERLINAQDLARQSLDAIREIRRHGPYVIGGYCYGGVVAFEAASQLIEAGEEVSLLVLLDTPTPGYPKILRHWRRYLKHAAGLLQGSAVSGSDVLAHLEALRRIVGRRIGASANRALARPNAGSKSEQTWNAVIMREYVPRPMPSRILQFLASDDPVSTAVLTDPRLGWQDFAQGGFQTQWTPGDHVSMLQEPHVVGLAVELEKVLRSCDAAGFASQQKMACGS